MSYVNFVLCSISEKYKTHFNLQFYEEGTYMTVCSVGCCDSVCDSVL